MACQWETGVDLIPLVRDLCRLLSADKCFLSEAIGHGGGPIQKKKVFKWIRDITAKATCVLSPMWPSATVEECFKSFRLGQEDNIFSLFPIPASKPLDKYLILSQVVIWSCLNEDCQECILENLQSAERGTASIDEMWSWLHCFTIAISSTVRHVRSKIPKRKKSNAQIEYFIIEYLIAATNIPITIRGLSSPDFDSSLSTNTSRTINDSHDISDISCVHKMTTEFCEYLNREDPAPNEIALNALDLFKYGYKYSLPLIGPLDVDFISYAKVSVQREKDKNPNPKKVPAVASLPHQTEKNNNTTEKVIPDTKEENAKEDRKRKKENTEKGKKNTKQKKIKHNNKENTEKGKKNTKHQKMKHKDGVTPGLDEKKSQFPESLPMINTFIRDVTTAIIQPYRLQDEWHTNEETTARKLLKREVSDSERTNFKMLVVYLMIMVDPNKNGNLCRKVLQHFFSEIEDKMGSSRTDRDFASFYCLIKDTKLFQFELMANFIDMEVSTIAALNIWGVKFQDLHTNGQCE